MGRLLDIVNGVMSLEKRGGHINMTKNRLNLRPCVVKYSHDGETTSRDAYFHMWCDNSKIVEPSLMPGGHNGGIIRYVTALVEYEDGSIGECNPNCICFKD